MIRCLAAAALLSVSTMASALEIAVVDFQRAATETTEGKAAQERLESMYSSRKSEIERMQGELEAELTDYQARQMILSPQAKQETEEELMRKQQQFEQTYQQYQQEMQQTYYTLLAELDEKLRTTVSSIARERKVDLVIDAQTSLYVGANVPDLTQLLIEKYNSQSSN